MAVRGKVWRELTAGMAVGQPLGAWVYELPGSEHGISRDELAVASSTVQHSTATFWFLSNYTPYELKGAYFGFQSRDVPSIGALNAGPVNSAPLNAAPFSDGSNFSDQSGFDQSPWLDATVAGFGQAPFAPSSFHSEEVLASEFGEVLTEALKRQIAAELPGRWMARSNGLTTDSLFTKLSAPDLQLEILKRLDELETQLRQLRPAHGEIGHNVPPEEFPLTAQEQEQAIAEIAEARTTVSWKLPLERNDLEQAIHTFRSIAKRLLLWVVDKIDVMATEASKSVGKRAGEIIFVITVAHSSGDIAALIEHLLHK